MLRRLVMLLLPMFVFGACQQKPATPNDQNQELKPTMNSSPQKNILFFGNSLTAAYQLEPEQGFTHLIQEKIDSLHLPYACVNAGLSGETTADGKNRINWVLQQPVEVFFLELGGNDALRGLPVEESGKNLQAILNAVKTKYPNCKIILAGMLAPPNMGNRYTQDFKNLFPELAQKNQATLIPFLLQNVGGVPALNLPDGIHPNVEGHKIVAETIWKHLKPLL
ncbi:MAG: arylesterase [Bacteroidetes bacterium]|nr:arylesterase [Bacteroidota bacterium]